MTQTLQNRILAYFRNHPDEFISSKDIQIMVMQKTTFLARTAVRALQLLHEDGRLEVEYRGKRGHSFYKYVKSPYEKMHERLQYLTNNSQS